MKIYQSFRIFFTVACSLFALFFVTSSIFYLLVTGENRLMFMGDDWMEIRYYVGTFNGKYSLFDVFGKVDSWAVHQQAITRILTLFDIKFGDGTVSYAMWRAIFLQLGSAFLVSLAIFRVKNFDLITKIFLSATTCALFTSVRWLSHLFIAQHQSWSLTIFFALLTIFFLTKLEEDAKHKVKSIIWIILIILSGTSCLYSWGNGLLIFPLVFFLGYINKIHRTLPSWLLVVSSVIAVAIIGFYIPNMIIVSGDNVPFYKQPINTLYYFLQLLGDPASGGMLGRKIGALVGAAILSLFLFVSYRYLITYKKLDKSQTILFGFVIFIIGSLAMTAIGRVGWLEGEEKLPPLRFEAIPLALLPALFSLLFMEVKNYTRNRYIEIGTMLFIMCVTIPTVSLRRWNINELKQSLYYDDVGVGAISRIAVAIGAGSERSLYGGPYFKDLIRPLLPEIEKYKIGPANWHETRWLGLKINKDFNLSSDSCLGVISKIRQFPDKDKPSLGFEGILKESATTPDLVIMSDNQDTVIGLAIVITPYKELLDYILNKKGEMEFLGASLWKEGNNKITFWGLNKKNRNVCEIVLTEEPNFHPQHLSNR